MTEPLTTSINLPNGNTFAVGSDMSIQCVVTGFPRGVVSWFKDDVPLEPSDRVQISTGNLSINFILFIINANLLNFSLETNRLVVRGAGPDDSGYYKCAARNDFSWAEHAAQINVEGTF